MNLLHEAQAELGRSNMDFAKSIATVSIAESMASVAASLKILAGPRVEPDTEMQKVYDRLAEAVAANNNARRESQNV